MKRKKELLTAKRNECQKTLELHNKNRIEYLNHQEAIETELQTRDREHLDRQEAKERELQTQDREYLDKQKLKDACSACKDKKYYWNSQLNETQKAQANARRRRNRHRQGTKHVFPQQYTFAAAAAFYLDEELPVSI